jgi:hypothetical protein
MCVSYALISAKPARLSAKNTLIMPTIADSAPKPAAGVLRLAARGHKGRIAWQLNHRITE